MIRAIVPARPFLPLTGVHQVKYRSFLQQRSARTPAALLARMLFIGASLTVAGCGKRSVMIAPAPATAAAPTRVGLKAGLANAEQAQWNMTLASNSPSPAGFWSTLSR